MIYYFHKHLMHSNKLAISLLFLFVSCSVYSQSNTIKRKTVHKQKVEVKIKGKKADKSQSRAKENSVSPKETKQQNGFLKVETTPIDAEVLIDYSLMGTTPSFLQKLSTGKHHVRIKKDGYSDYETDVEIKAGETYTLDAILSIKTIMASFNCNVDRVNIFVDDNSYGMTAVIPLTIGTHHVTITKDGFKPIVNETIEVSSLNSSFYFDLKPDVKDDGQVFTVNLSKEAKSQSNKQKDTSYEYIHVTKDRNSASGMTYVGDVSDKYGIGLFKKLNRQHWDKMIKRMQKKAAKLGARRILITSENDVDEYYSIVGYVSASAYR